MAELQCQIMANSGAGPVQWSKDGFLLGKSKADDYNFIIFYWNYGTYITLSNVIFYLKSCSRNL